MISVTGFIDILKNNQLWVADQSIDEGGSISGKPVTDSRLISRGDAFVCIKGYESDGHDYISQACEKGAAIIIQQDEFTHSLPAVRVTNSRKAAALLAKYYFDNPTAKFDLIGITGTNGKTTTSLLLWQALTGLGHKTGWIGTLGYRTGTDIITTNNTTPDIMELNEIFAMMVEAGCKYVVMEVSSHALALDRVFGLEFDLALFTNLSREHLDFHRDMQDYFESKYLLFEYVIKQNGTSIINIDDEYGKLIEKRIRAVGKFRLKTVSEQQGSYTISGSSFSTNGSQCLLSKKSKPAIALKTGLVGHFNMLNTVMAAITLKELFPDITATELQNVTANLQPVRGRLEQVENNRNIGIYVDYAHTPEALKNVLETLQKLPHNRIITVFGAGGDRDKGKRSEMLSTVLAASDATIITDDNPRTENPNQIIKDIVGDNNIKQPWWIVRDRRLAIEAALRLAQDGDIVLLAGKGHETYQEIRGKKYPFDDVQIASEMAEKTWEPEAEELVLPVEAVMLEILYHSEFVALNEAAKSLKHISTDSRTIKPGSLYFALRGEIFDGMDFISSVLSDKSNCAVVHDQACTEAETIYAKDTQAALGLLAGKYLQMFGVQKIALTGSTGKTTAKEYLANIFSQAGKTLKTRANENNIIGLSKTIFRIRPEDNFAIFELGSNHFGEIKFLAEVCRPDLAIITNIGPSHLEFFGDEDGVYREKTDLFRREIKTIIYPGDDKRFNEFSERGKSVGFTKDCDYLIAKIVQRVGQLSFKLNKQEWKVKQHVPYFIANVAFAIAAALESGISPTVIQKGLNRPVELSLRMEIVKLGKLTIINDCYNANPVSMKAAIEFWISYLPEKPHAAILGDMLELGIKADEYHKGIGELLDKLDFESLITVGNFSEHFHGSGKHPSKNPSGIFRHYQTIYDLDIKPFLALSKGEMVVLIKASHGVHLEKVYEAVRQQVMNHKPKTRAGK